MKNMKTFQGDNPSALHLEVLAELMEKGDEVAPRGKKIKEIRPASVEFLDPLKRVFFLRGRRINPYFNLAESLWIISGKSDVAFLELFNRNMKNFSDDGIYFNAPYGERLRSYGKNDAHQTIYNPVDQLTDCYIKLKADRDTRQAVAVISAPHFDNSKYTIGEKGRDIACNLVITFKIRDNKLNMCVFNRSNDVIWGMFGANLCQFSTIQEMMAVWLGVEVGTYHQITDSLHIYTEDYGSNGNKAIFDAHPGLEEGKYCPWDMIDCKENSWWYFKTEPRMALNKEETDLFLEFFWSSIAPKLANDEFVTNNSMDLLQVLYTDEDYTKLTDDYWRMTISAMFAYRHIRLKQYDKAMEILDKFVPNSSWKVSMVYFLKSIVEKQMREDPDNIESIKSVMLYGKLVDSLVKSCLTDSDDLYDYLVLLEE